MSEKTITVTSPNREFSGISAGVLFSAGKAEVLADNRAALEYFQRKGFGISADVPAPKGEDSDLRIDATEATVVVPQGEGVTEVTGTKLEDLSRAELEAEASKLGIDASKAKNKGEVIALISASDKVPSLTATEVQAGIQSTGTTDVAGDGPAGPIHNVGRDGADPDAKDPVTGTPDAPTGI